MSKRVDDIDTSGFAGHYATSRNTPGQRRLQRLYSAWHFYAEPLCFAFFPGKLFSDLYFGTTAGLALATFLGGTTCLALAPVLIRFRLRRNAHRRHYVHYVAAIEKCIDQAQEITRPS